MKALRIFIFLSVTLLFSSSFVHAAAVSATVAVKDKVYDKRTTTKITSCTLSGVDPLDARYVGCTAVATLPSADVGVHTPTVSVTLTGTRRSKYTLSTTSVNSVTVTPKILTPSVSVASKIYDGTTTVTGTVTLSGVISGDVITRSVDVRFLDANVGTARPAVATVSFGGASAGNYSLSQAEVQKAATISKRAIVVTPFAQTKYLTQPDPEFTYSVTNLAPNETLVGTLSRRAGETARRYAFTIGTLASQNPNYSITLRTNYLTIVNALPPPTAIAAHVTPESKVYDGTTRTTLTCTLTGVPAGDAASVRCVGNGTFNSAAVGEQKQVTPQVWLEGASAHKYTIAQTTSDTAAITPRILSLSYGSSPTKRYDGTTAIPITVTSTNTIVGDVVTITAVGRTQTKDVGAAVPVYVDDLLIAGSSASNYLLPDMPTASIASTAITPISVTVTPVSVTKDAGDEDPVFTYTATGVLVPDTFSGELARSAGETAGVYSLTIGTLSLGENYTITLAPATLTIVKDIVPPTFSRVAPITVEANEVKTVVNYSQPTATDSKDGNTQVFCLPSPGTMFDVGVTTIHCHSKDAAGNIAEISFTLTVKDATAPVVTLTGASHMTLPFRSNFVDPGATAQDAIDGLIPVVVSGSVNTEKAGIYALTYKATDEARNVSLPVTRTVEVQEPISLTVQISAQYKEYDGTTNVKNPTCTVQNMLPEHLGKVACTPNVFFDNAHVGIGKQILGSATLSGDAKDYYVIGDVHLGSASIVPKLLTITGGVQDKVYDGTTTAQAALSLVGVLGGDQVSASGTAAFDSKNGGANKTVNISNVTLSGASAGNYSVPTTATATGKITPKMVTVLADASNKTYDGNINATVTLTLSGIVPGDTVNASGTGQFSDATPGAGKVVTVSGITLSGADASNYAPSSVNIQTTAAITTPVISITALASEKTYIEDDPILKYTVSPSSLSSALLGKLSRIAGEDVGTYAITQGTLSAGPYYTINFVSAPFSITKRRQLTSFTEIADREYSFQPFPVYAIVGSGLPAVYSATGSCTINGNLISSVPFSGNTSQCSITASHPGNTNYLPALPVTHTFTIKKKITQSIILSSLPDTVEVNSGKIPASASSTSGLPVSITATGVCTYSQGELLISGIVGSCIITASQAGNAEYEAAANVTYQITVKKVPQSIAIDLITPVFVGGASVTPRATATSGLIITFSVTGTCSYTGGVITPIAAGSCTITAKQIGNETYESAQAQQVFTISLDTLPPVIDDYYDMTAIEAEGPQGTRVTFSYPTATDNADGNVAVTCDREQGSMFPVGKTYVHCSATDRAGNRTSQDFYVEVVDTVPPIITIRGDATIELYKGTPFTDPGATCTDAVSGECVEIGVVGSVDVNTLGTYEIAYTANDASVNTGRATRIVKVIARPYSVALENQPPVVTVTPAVVVLRRGSPFNPLMGVKAVDVVDGEVPVTVSGIVNTGVSGFYKVRYTAVDSKGRISYPVYRTVRVK